MDVKEKLNQENQRDISAQKEFSHTRRYLFLYAAVSIFIALFFGVLLYFKITCYETVIFMMGLTAVLGVIGFGLLAVQENHFQVLTIWKKRALTAVMIAVLLSMQISYVGAIRADIAHDFNQLYQAAERLASDLPLGSGYAEYFARFPNNRFLLLVFTMLFRLCDQLHMDYDITLIVLNVLIVDLTILLCYMCTRKWTDRKTARTGLLFTVPVLGFHRSLAVPYSDTLSMIFPVLLLFLYACMKKKRRFIYPVLMGICTVIGYYIKPQAAILISAMLSFRPSVKRFQSLLKYGGCLLLAAILTVTAVASYTQWQTGDDISDALKEEQEITPAHYLMMGLNPRSGGFFSSEDYDATLSHGDRDARVRFNLSEVKRRLADMNVIGYIKFIAHKNIRVFESAHMDVWMRAPFVQTDPFSVAIQGMVYHENDGYDFYCYLLQAWWILVFLFIVLPIVCSFKKGRGDFVFLLRLELFGFVLFMTLFEAGNRYLINQIPIFSMLAAWGVHNNGVLPMLHKAGEWIKKRRRAVKEAAG